MATKAKKKINPMPKLGFADHCIYCCAIALCIVFGVCSPLISTLVCEAVAFSDPQVLGCNTSYRSFHECWLLIWSLVVLLPLMSYYGQRYPIFGRTDIKYGPPAHPHIYPLFMENKPGPWTSPSQKQKRRRKNRIIVACLVISFLFSAAMLPRSFYGREVLCRDGSIILYNDLNREARCYSLREIRSVRFDTYRMERGSSYRAEMVIESADGKSHRFNMHAFEGDELETLQTMLSLKDFYGELCTVSGTENLHLVARNLNNEEKALLYELFDYYP